MSILSSKGLLRVWLAVGILAVFLQLFENICRCRKFHWVLREKQCKFSKSLFFDNGHWLGKKLPYTCSLPLKSFIQVTNMTAFEVVKTKSSCLEKIFQYESKLSHPFWLECRENLFLYYIVEVLLVIHFYFNNRHKP